MSKTSKIIVIVSISLSFAIVGTVCIWNLAVDYFSDKFTLTIEERYGIKEKTFSDEFLNSFLDNYSVVDPNLHLSSDVVGLAGGGIVSSRDRDYDLLIYPTITGNSDYLQATREDGFTIFNDGSCTYVYTKNGCADPINDWTIKNVEFYSIDQGFDEYEDLYTPELAGKYNKRKLLYSWIDNGKDERVIRIVRDFLKSEGTADHLQREHFKIEKENGEYDTFHVIMRITFEENEDLSWVAIIDDTDLPDESIMMWCYARDGDIGKYNFQHFYTVLSEADSIFIKSILGIPLDSEQADTETTDTESVETAS